MACHMVSSSAAAVASAFIRVPGDVLKHRIQVCVSEEHEFTSLDTHFPQRVSLPGDPCAEVAASVAELALSCLVIPALKLAPELSL
eukprot:scaffold56077_cov17-Tisochrysis_lutea.AAC.2